MSTNSKPIKIAIIDDQQLIIDGISSLLNQTDEVEVVGCTNQGNEAEQLIIDVAPEVVLLDLRFKDQELDGIEIASILSKKFPSLKILMLTSFDDFASVKESFRQGILGYLIKNTDKEELINAINVVHSGNVYIAPSISKIIVDDWKIANKIPFPDTSDKSLDEENYHPLTARELEVALLAAKGMERKQIAKHLFISNNTVGTHLTRIYAKLDINNVAEMINWLIKKQLM